MKRLILFLLLATILVAGQADAATLTTEIARVREYLYQDTAANSTITDTAITEAINTSQDLLSNLLSYSANYENIVFTSLNSTTTGEVSATLPVDLKKIISVSIIYPGSTYLTAKPLIQIKPEEWTAKYYSGTAKDPVYSVVNSRLTFWPANTGGTLTIMITYLRAYTTLSSGGTTITVQDRYLNLLTLASVWYILQADNQQARAANIYKLLTDLVTIENNSMANSNIIERIQGGSK